MRIEVEYELDKLKDMLKKNRINPISNFVIDDEYEFEYSHLEISEIQDEFVEEAKKYLKENYEGQYVIMHTPPFYVCIMAIEYYKDKNLKGGIIC